MSKKAKKKQIDLKIVMGLIILCLLIVFNFSRIQLLYKGYSWKEQNLLLEESKEERQIYLDIDKKIDIEYWQQYKNDGHYYEYDLVRNRYKKPEDAIDYVDGVESKYVDILFSKGYSQSNVWTAMKKLNIEEMGALVKKDISWKNLKPYLDIEGRIIEDIPEYIDSHLPAKKAVMFVSYGQIDSSNILAKKREYNLLEPDAIDLLIKRGFCVSERYVPKDLVKVKISNAPGNENNQLRKEAANALENMAHAAKKKGLHIALNSAYRSYKEQETIYNEYFSIYDPQTAASLVAIPGCSEHQLGLSVDLTSQSVIDGQKFVFGDTPEYAWTLKNAYKYGFILRYPEGKTEITGTTNEPWHFRYVGKKLAKKLYGEDMTLEEYTLKYGFSYPVNLKG